MGVGSPNFILSWVEGARHEWTWVVRFSYSSLPFQAWLEKNVSLAFGDTSIWHDLQDFQHTANPQAQKANGSTYSWNEMHNIRGKAQAVCWKNGISLALLQWPGTDKRSKLPSCPVRKVALKILHLSMETLPIEIFRLASISWTLGVSFHGGGNSLRQRWTVPGARYAHGNVSSEKHHPGNYLLIRGTWTCKRIDCVQGTHKWHLMKKHLLGTTVEAHSVWNGKWACAKPQKTCQSCLWTSCLLTTWV